MQNTFYSIIIKQNITLGNACSFTTSNYTSCNDGSIACKLSLALMAYSQNLSNYTRIQHLGDLQTLLATSLFDVNTKVQ